eukprot:9114426-Pyramimonas_sp.AAC.1
MDANSLYSLEVLVTHVQVFENLPADAHRKLAVAVRLLDYPLLLIPPSSEPVNNHTDTLRSKGELSFNTGKSCLFKGKPAEVQELLRKHYSIHSEVVPSSGQQPLVCRDPKLKFRAPVVLSSFERQVPLFVLLVDVSNRHRPRLQGTSSFPLAGSNMRAGLKTTKGGYLKDTLTLYSMLGHKMGEIGLFVRIRCRGHSMLTHFDEHPQTAVTPLPRASETQRPSAESNDTVPTTVVPSPVFQSEVDVKLKKSKKDSENTAEQTAHSQGPDQTKDVTSELSLAETKLVGTSRTVTDCAEKSQTQSVDHPRSTSLAYELPPNHPPPLYFANTESDGEEEEEEEMGHPEAANNLS